MIERMLNISVNNTGLPIHWHERFTELYFVIKGEVFVNVHGEDTELGEGDISVVNYDVPHKLTGKTDEYLYIRVQFDTKAFERYIPGISKVYFKIEDVGDNSFAGLKDEIKKKICDVIDLTENIRWAPHREKKIISACVEILNDLKYGFSLLLNKGESNYDEAAAGVIWRTTDYIFDNANRNITLREVAKRENVSESQLSKMFVALMGKNFRDTLAYIRAECAMKYLIESNMTITDIAYTCGFSAPRYFNAAFEKFFEMTPKEFRESNRGFLKNFATVVSDSVIFGEGVDKDEVFGLMDKYRRDFSINWEKQSATIDLDKAADRPSRIRISGRANAVRCSKDELCSMEKHSLLVEVRERLGISKIIMDSDGRETDRAGSLKLNELFTDDGYHLPEYYKQELLSDIGDHYISYSDSIYVDSRGECASILVVNIKNEKTGSVSLHFTAGEEKAPCVVTEKVVRIPAPDEREYVKHLRARGQNALLELVSKPTTESYIVENINGYDMDIKMREVSVALVSIRRI